MGLSLCIESDELDVISACVRQEQWAQQIIYEEFFGVLMGVSLRYSGSYDEAMDILHDGFIKIFQKIDQYQPGTSLKNWMSRIVVNTAIDHYRKNKKNQTDELDLAVGHLDKAPGPLQALAEKELLLCIQQLPPSYRTIFNLYVVEGYSHKEIGEKIGITESTSRSNLVKARQKLKIMVEKYNLK